ncbi:MAG TPA: helix-turn-helix transcriptional regulator [Solirubrobacterales bacterium]|nr:helix-turn-helix transcriptional regulator [Solirubrobacterales bacterium]
MKVEQRFGENLIRLRHAAGLSQEQLGFAAELHRTEIGMLERGVRMARIDTLAKLAGALDTTPNDLMAGIAWTPGGFSRGHFSGCHTTEVPF